MELFIEEDRPKSSWNDLLTEQPIEEWDDNDFANLDDIQLRSASTTSSASGFGKSQLTHADRRDSLRSRLSARSDRDSNNGDHEWGIPVDEQSSVEKIRAAAASKGIPLPANVPTSALVGGTIRKMPGKKISKALADDWSEDLDFDGPLKLRLTPSQVSSAIISPEKADNGWADDDFELPADGLLKPRDDSAKIPIISLPPKQTSPKKIEDEDFEKDFELPSDGLLKKRQPATPYANITSPEDIDFEWAEGSLGTRNGGTRRDGRSNRSSSGSVLSPSMSSAITESEDEGWDDLVLPTGPLKFDELLKKRQEQQSPDQTHYSGERHAAGRAATKEDFFAGIDIGDGDVFESRKMTINRNVKHKVQPSTSPTRRPATTLTFTNIKSQSTISRLPRFQSTHDRTRSTLEPVSESGTVIPAYRRPDSRLAGHSAQSSVSSIPAPPTPSTPSTPSRRRLRAQESNDNMCYDPPTTTNAQLLRAKRSMPVLRSLNSPSKPPSYPRPQSRNNDAIQSRPHIPSRPKTPTERAESRLGERRPPVPFLPAGASTTQSQHVSIKAPTTRHYRRNDSDGSASGSAAALRTQSRLGYRPETPGRNTLPRGSLTPLELAAAAKKPITKPSRRRNFGDGTELEIFDDLPTSASAESKFVKAPVGRGAPRSLRSKLLGQNLYAPSTTSLTTLGGAESPMPPLTPLSPTRMNPLQSSLPRFARDTAASRNAREQRQVSSTYAPPRERGPLTPLTDVNNWKQSTAAARLAAHLSAAPTARGRKPGGKHPVQLKPHLIKPMGDSHSATAKRVKGMQYNPATFRWEGNENEAALEQFDVSDFLPRGKSPETGGPAGSPRGGKPPALITNVGIGPGGVQVVGEMVFDPRVMKWLKLAPGGGKVGQRGGGGSVGTVEDEEDVFAGLEDLKEESSGELGTNFGLGAGKVGKSGGGGIRQFSGATADGHNSGDEFVLGEEFDVGPEFIRRQRGEEEKWRRRVEGWLREDEVEGEAWRWAIREVVNGSLAA